MSDELQPPDIDFENQVFELDFHPQQHIVAAGLIDGTVEIHQLGPQNSPLFSQTLHQESVRSVQFHPGGQLLVTGSADKSIRALEVGSGTVVQTIANAHPHPINVIKMLDETSLISGDDEGILKIWDMRQQACVRQFKEHTDFISDLQFHHQSGTLLATSGDGKLSVYDLRAGAMLAVSDDVEDELLSCLIMKGGRKVVCGTQLGVLSIFSWGDWGDMSDRFPGHPNSVDTMVAIDDDTFCTGSSDGLIRIVQIHPNKLLGVVGEHEDFPIECIRLSHDRVLMGSSSHDNTIKLWNVQYLCNDDDGDDDNNDGDAANTAGAGPTAADAIGGGGGGGDSDSDSDSDDMDDGAKARGGGKTFPQSRDARDFFSDL